MSETSEPVTCVTVGGIMAPPPAPVQAGDELRSALKARIEADLVALPVTDEKGHLAGGRTRQGLLEVWWAGRLC